MVVRVITTIGVTGWTLAFSRTTLTILTLALT